jgi:hypothetical protein
VRVLFLLLLVAAAIAAAALPIDERTAPAPEPRADGGARGERAPENDARRPRPLRRARCPDAVAGCRAVSGRVLYVERVDPDGDGDLHVVVLDGSVTAPGMTAVDVRRGLRPPRDPRVGDRVSAAGPVQPGSYGQSQIHALEFHMRRG